jgi:hypothetical protein
VRRNQDQPLRRGLLAGVTAALLALVGCRSAVEPPPAPASSVQVPRFAFGHIANPLLDVDGQSGFVLAAESDLLLVDAMNQLHGPEPQAGTTVQLLMIGGNLIHNTGSGRDDLQLLCRRLRAASFPVYAILGPRDTRCREPGAATRGQVLTALRGQELPGGQPYYDVQPAPGLHFVVLDTTEPAPGGGGIIGPRQLRWLERTLASIPAEEVVFVFCHHLLTTARPPGLDWRFSEHVLRNAPEVNDLLTRHRAVKLVITSSLGFPIIRTIDGLHHVATPALCHYPCALRRFTVEGNQVQVETLPVSDPKVETLARLQVMEDPRRTWEHYDFSDPEEFMAFLRGHNDHWQGTLTMR